MAKLNMTSLKLEVGDKKALNLTGGVGTTKWSSKNVKIATVTSKGIVTGVSAGKTTITATNQKKNYICSVEIKKGTAKLNLNNVTIKVGETVKLKVLNTNATPIWNTSDKGIATCKNGNIKGIKSGACVITATIGKEEYVCAVEVGEAAQAGAVDKKIDLSHSSVIVDDKGTIDPFAVRQLIPSVSYIYKKDGKYKEVNVSNRLEDIQYSEAADGQADMITAVLDNIDGKFYEDYFPELGYAMNFKLQYRNWNPTQYASKALSIDYGQFVVDEVKYNGYPTTVEVSATSKPRETAFDTTLRSETYKNKTIEEIAKKICSDKKDKDGKERNYNMTVIYNAKKVTVNKTQDNQTDSEFLKELADDYGLCMKISNRRLILYSLRKAETAEIKGIFDLDGVDETKDYKSKKPPKDVEPGWIYNNSLTGMYDGCAIRFTAGGSGKSWLRIVYLNDLDKNISDINNIVATQKENNSSSSDSSNSSDTTDATQVEEKFRGQKFKITSSEMKQLAIALLCEDNESYEGMCAVASHLNNLYNAYVNFYKSKNGYGGNVCKFMYNSRWYGPIISGKMSHGRAAYANSTQRKKMEKAITKCLVNGVLTIPRWVDEFDGIGEIYRYNRATYKYKKVGGNYFWATPSYAKHYIAKFGR